MPATTKFNIQLIKIKTKTTLELQFSFRNKAFTAILIFKMTVSSIRANKVSICHLIHLIMWLNNRFQY